MDKAEVARALQEYEDAMTEFLTSVRARDSRSDFPLRQRLYAASPASASKITMATRWPTSISSMSRAVGLPLPLVPISL